MGQPSGGRRQSLRGFVGEALGLSADISGAVQFLGFLVLALPIAAAAGTFVIGLVPVALALLLTGSVLVNGFLAYRLFVEVQRVGRIRLGVEAVVAELKPAETRPASKVVRQWLTDPADAGSLAQVSETQLDQAHRTAEAAARDLLGEDAVVVMASYYAKVKQGGYGSFHFLGHSRLGEKTGTFLVGGPEESSAFTGTCLRDATDPIGNRPPRPWHLDHTWKELVRRAWAKERPFSGDLWLNYEDAHWRLTLAAVRDGLQEPTKVYVLDGNDLKEEA